MTTNIAGKDSFRGFPVIALREVLRAWQRGNKYPDAIGKQRKVSLDGGAVVAILQEARDAGLMGLVTDPELDPFPALAHINKPRLGLTDEGLSVMTASAAGRMEKKKAQAVFRDLLDRAAAVNADPKAPCTVNRVWLFGSMTDDSKADVGDIDFVVEWDGSEAVKGMKGREVLDYVKENYPDMIPESFNPAYGSARSAFLSRSLYGKRRHHMLAPNDMDTLQGLHCPCQLVFDSGRGGIVDDPVLPHHPESTARSDTIRPRLKIPDLSAVAGEFLPSSADWASGVHWRGSASDSRGMQVHCEDSGMTKEAGLSGLDGRSRFAVSLSGKDREGAVVLLVERSSDRSDDYVTYRCSVSVASDTSRHGLAPEDVKAFGKVLDTLVASDCARLAGRRHDLGGMEVIAIHVHAPEGQEYDRDGRYPGLRALACETASGAARENVVPEQCRFSIDCYDGDDMLGGYVWLQDLEDEDWAEWGDRLPFTRSEVEAAFRAEPGHGMSAA